MTTVLLDVSVILLAVCALQASRFVVRYSRVQWKRTPAGRHLMGLTRALALILWGTLVLSVVPLWLWLGLLIQATLFGWLAFELTRRNRLFTIAQRENRR